MNYIIDNDYYLIDANGKHTQWGVWNPTFLNDDPLWYDERGVNSMQILSWILSAYSIEPDQKFLDAFHYLVDNYDYDTNVINAKITQPSDINYSDDELTFLPYFTYLFSKSSRLSHEVKLSMKRTWHFEFIQTMRSALWNIIYGTTGVEEFGLKEAVWCLRTYPISQINWPVNNDQRTDFFWNPETGRTGNQEGLKIFPYDELNLYRWNTDPFDSQSGLEGGDGHSETDPSAWLLPYWMARYYGYIV